MFDRADKPLEEREYPDESDLAEVDSEEEGKARFVFCRACGEPMYTGSPRCPHCGHWSAGDEGWRASRKWYVRAGLYLFRFILVNWLFWLLATGAAAVVTILELSR